MDISVKKIKMEDQDLIRLKASAALTISERLQLLLKLQQLSFLGYIADENYLKKSLNKVTKKAIDF